MRVISRLALLSALALGRPIAEEEEGPECTVLKSIKLSFYGRQDVTDPISYPECGRTVAGGKGTYESPITMASAPGEFAKCEIVYIPYLLKYVRFEDICMDCVRDYSMGKMHMSVWTGNSMSGGQEQLQCEKDFAPLFGLPMIHTPPRGMIVDTTPLYRWGARDSCALDHRYKVVNENAFCFDTRTERVEDHWQDQQNSVQAMRHPYPRPEDEQPIYEPQQQVMQDSAPTYQAEESGWSLMTEDPATSAAEPRIIL